MLRLTTAVLTEKNADPRALSGRLPPVTVAWWVRWVAGSAKVVKACRAVGVHLGAAGDVGISEDRDLRGGEALDDLHHDRSHAPVRVTLAGDDDAGFARGSAALVALAAEIDVIGLDRRADAAGAAPSA